MFVVDAPARRIPPALRAVSALFATNGWLAFRALGVSLAGATLFWCARTLARAGREPAAADRVWPLAIVLGALTGLAQAYGLIDTSLASLSRAPGGTFGNRNFMAHLVAIGLPLLLYLALEARSRARFALGAAGVALAAAALVLSRSRAAWLGAGGGRESSSRSRGSGWAGSGPTTGSGAACCSSPAWRWRGSCSRWSCPTGSTGGRTRPTSIRSPASPTTRKGAGAAG